jgi:hypothetical protein
MVFTLALSAQKVRKERIEFDYTQLPLEPIDEAVKTYHPKVIVGYADEEAEKQRLYEEEKKKKEEEFAQEKKEYKDKSLGKKLLEKTLLDEGKPKEDVVARPTYRPVYNVDALANSYLILEGFEKGEDGVLYEVTLEGLKSTDPVMKSSSSKNKEGVETWKYWYEVTYHYPMTVRLEVEGDEIINEMFEQLEVEQTYETKKYSSSSALRKALSPNAVMKAVDNKALKANLNYVNSQINERFGYMQKTRKATIYTGKGKADYTDLTKAYIAMEQGLVEKAEGGGAEKMKEAIELWNKALEEKDFDNKKARINKNIGFGLYLNLIEANILVEDFKAAKAAINAILLMSPSKSDEKKLDAYRDYYDDIRDRYDANNE